MQSKNYKEEMIRCKQLHCREELGMDVMEVNKQTQWPVGMYKTKNHLKASKQGNYKPIKKERRAPCVLKSI